MKRKRNLLVCTFFALLLCGCAALQPAEEPSPAGLSPEGEERTEGTKADAATLLRPEHTELTLLAEGQAEQVPVTLWAEEGFSLYLPSSGWQCDEYGLWTADENVDVQLFVTFYESQTADEVAATAAKDYPDYVFTPQPEGGWEGYDSRHNMTLKLTPLETADGSWVVYSRYPTEAAEGFGSRLAGLAATFALS